MSSSATSRSDRAVSTALGYVLTLGIATILISGLLIAAGTAVEDRRDVTTRSSLDVAGERLASNLMSADRLAETSGARAVSVAVDLPSRIAGNGYLVTVDPANSTLVLVSDGPDVTVHVRFTTTTPVAAATVRGGDLRVVLSAGRLEVRSV
ncbi:DUF7266 family protein [Haloplanus salilacus]|uniref:DUF7266 family protein n=1 Tax=Haloplanus salilacus TaxID=2949994 RepID=UPI0030D216DD